jgi:hypothetical protein
LYSDCIVAVRGATGKLVWYYQEVPGDDWDYDSIADLMLADLNFNGRTRHVVMHAPKDGFFYVLDRVTGELISADPFTKVSWASGVDSKTGRPNVNPAARYGAAAIRVMPGPAGGHVWPPWSYNPSTGLVYIPGTSGQTYTYRASPDFVATPKGVGPTGRGAMNMGTAFGGIGRGGAGRGGAGAVPAAVEAATPGTGTPPAATPSTTPSAPGGVQNVAPEELPAVGPDGPTGNVLFAWDPVARKERWRAAGAGAGPFSGGSLATAGNLVLSSVNDRLLIFRADTGEKLLEVQTGLTQMGPPITFLIDGKQYISVSGGPRSVGGGRGGAPDATPSGPKEPAHLVAFVLDGKAPLPGPAASSALTPGAAKQ